MRGHEKKRVNLTKKESIDQETLGKIRVDFDVVPPHSNAKPILSLIPKNYTHHSHPIQRNAPLRNYIAATINSASQT